MSFDALSKGLAAGVGPFYLIVSPSGFLLHRAAALVIESALGAGAADFNVDRYQAGQDSLSAVRSIARTYPMMARRRVIRIAGGENLAADDAAMLVELAKEAMDHCTIVVLAAKVDRRSALVKAAQAAKGFFDWEKLSAADVASWAKRMASESGKKLPDDAAAFLAQQFGTDLERIRSEIEKASLYAGAETDRLALEDIQVVMVAIKTESVFDLTDAVGEKNRAKAFYFLDGMLATGSVPIRVHATIYRHIRKLLAVKELSEQGWDADRIAKEIGAHPYAVGKMKTQAGRYRLADLRFALPILSQADFDLKNSRADHRVVLEKMILDLCRSGA